MDDLRLQLVAADVGVMGVVSGLPKSEDFGERGGGCAGPAVAGGEVQDSHDVDAILRAEMAIDAELLEILACPLCKQEVRLVPLSEARRVVVRDKFREKFRGEEPVVENGLQCVKCHRIYPVVSDIPVMLVDEAFEEA